MMVANEFLGGCGLFLTQYAGLCSAGVPAAAVSSTRLDDLVTPAHFPWRHWSRSHVEGKGLCASECCL